MATWLPTSPRAHRCRLAAQPARARSPRAGTATPEHPGSGAGCPASGGLDRLGHLDQPLDLREARVPAVVSRDVEPDAGQLVLRGCRAADREEVEIGADERVAVVAVARVEGQTREVREHVRVGVEARVDEVRDVRPAEAIALRQLD